MAEQAQGQGKQPGERPRVKVIIDTDPGVDDAMAILSALHWDRVEVLGMTTLFGNVPTAMATQNALILRDMAAHYDSSVSAIPIVQGSLTSFTGQEKHRIADFVHGKDGFGNHRPALSEACAQPGEAADFIIKCVHAHPGEVVVLALAATTNIALALQRDPTIADAWARVVVLGGAFAVNGNVNPAAEANVFGDPEAADYLLQHGKNVQLVGLDVTHDCQLSAAQLASLAGQGRHGTFLSAISDFYLQYHRDSYGLEAVFVHDSTAMIACVRPELFTWQSGAVVVCTEGHLRGKTLLDVTSKKWIGENEWMRRPKVQVAVAVQSEALVAQCMSLMTL